MEPPFPCSLSAQASCRATRAGASVMTGTQIHSRHASHRAPLDLICPALGNPSAGGACQVWVIWCFLFRCVVVRRPVSNFGSSCGPTCRDKNDALTIQWVVPTPHSPKQKSRGHESIVSTRDFRIFCEASERNPQTLDLGFRTGKHRKYQPFRQAVKRNRLFTEELHKKAPIRPEQAQRSFNKRKGTPEIPGRPL